MHKLKLIRAIISLQVFIICIPLLNAQVTEEWVVRYNGSANGYDKANKVITDASGNIYVTGSVVTNTGSWDYMTIKYNSSGVQQWAKIYNGTAGSFDQAYDIAIDNSGNIYVTGGSFGLTERDFCTIKYNSDGDSLWVRKYNGPDNDIDEAVRVLTDADNNVYITGYSQADDDLDYLTIKYNSDGVVLWTARYNFPSGGFGSEDRPTDMVIDDHGNVYITGESSDGVSFVDMYATVKYNSAGQQQWVARYKGWGVSGLSQAYAITVDGNGNVYVTGRCDPVSAFGYNFDIVTIKYNSFGDSLWVHRYNGPGNSSDIGYAISLDAEDNVIVTGLSVANTADFFTIKYSSSGNVIWTARYDGPANGIDAAYSMVMDDFGNIYVTGFSDGIGSMRDYATVKYNSAGVQQWVKRYNGPGNDDDEPLSIAIDAMGNIYVTGMSMGTDSNMDFATIKYSQPLSVNQISAEIPEAYSLFQNYPNPFNPSTIIKYSLIKNSNVSLKIFDLQGKEVSILVNETQTAGLYSIQFNASQLSSGIYFYQLMTSDFTDTKRMVYLK